MVRQRTQDDLVDARKRGVAFGRPSYAAISKNSLSNSSSKGFRTVQDTNAYSLSEPNGWGAMALKLFSGLFPQRDATEPPRVCRRPQLLRGWGYGNEEEDVEQIFT